MKPIYKINGLVHWSEREINGRERFTRYFADEISAFLRDQNKAWEIERVEGPIMMPTEMALKHYGDRDLWFMLQREMPADDIGLVARPETTPSTYAWMQHRLESQEGLSLPYCCWQVGKSFRNESTDSFRTQSCAFEGILSTGIPMRVCHEHDE